MFAEGERPEPYPESRVDLEAGEPSLRRAHSGSNRPLSLVKRGTLEGLLDRCGPAII